MWTPGSGSGGPAAHRRMNHQRLAAAPTARRGRRACGSSRCRCPARAGAEQRRSARGCSGSGTAAGPPRPQRYSAKLMPAGSRRSWAHVGPGRHHRRGQRHQRRARQLVCGMRRWEGRGPLLPSSPLPPLPSLSLPPLPSRSFLVPAPPLILSSPLPHPDSFSPPLSPPPSSSLPLSLPHPHPRPIPFPAPSPSPHTHPRPILSPLPPLPPVSLPLPSPSLSPSHPYPRPPSSPLPPPHPYSLPPLPPPILSPPPFPSPPFPSSHSHSPSPHPSFLFPSSPPPHPTPARSPCLPAASLSSTPRPVSAGLSPSPGLPQLLRVRPLSLPAPVSASPSPSSHSFPLSLCSLKCSVLTLLSCVFLRVGLRGCLSPRVSPFLRGSHFPIRD